MEVPPCVDGASTTVIGSHNETISGEDLAVFLEAMQILREKLIDKRRKTIQNRRNELELERYYKRQQQLLNDRLCVDCRYCNRRFKTNQTLSDHIWTSHYKQTFWCFTCHRPVSGFANFAQKHARKHSKI